MLLAHDIANRLRKLLVSPRIGIVNRIDVLENVQFLFGLCLVTVYPARMSGPAGKQLLSVAGGVGRTRTAAEIAAIMEIAERYCGYFGAEKRAFVGPALDASYMPGDSLGIFADWQFSDKAFVFRQHRPEANIHWLRGRSLVTGKTKYLPAAWVQVPFQPAGTDEHLFCSTSSGMAAAFTYDDCFLNGIFELIERDAFMIMWHQRIAMPRIDLDLADLMGKGIAQNISDADAQVRFVDLTTDLGVPVALCIIRRLWREHTIQSIGLAARGNLRAACEKAFYEAASESYRQFLEIQTAGELWRPAEDFSDVTEVWQHAGIYSLPQYLGELDFIWNVEQSIGLDDRKALPTLAPELLRSVLTFLHTHQLETIVVPIAAPEMTALGIKVAKVVIPGLVQFYADHRYPYLGTPRVWSVPEKLGLSVDSNRRQVSNSLPHPFS